MNDEFDRVQRIFTNLREYIVLHLFGHLRALKLRVQSKASTGINRRRLLFDPRCFLKY